VSDRMSMRHSLEARVPFLDLEHLALIERLPGDQRISLLRTRKHLQHAIARQLLPAPLQRGLVASGRPWRRKIGFSVPVAEWFRESVSRHLPNFLAGPDAVLPEYLDADVTRRRIENFLTGHGRAYRLPLVLFVLECWLRMQVAGVSPSEITSQLESGRRASAGGRRDISGAVSAPV
jgi:asparagine synthase (glutamine-hydrolysing)